MAFPDFFLSVVMQRERVLAPSRPLTFIITGIAELASYAMLCSGSGAELCLMGMFFFLRAHTFPIRLSNNLSFLDLILVHICPSLAVVQQIRTEDDTELQALQRSNLPSKSARVPVTYSHVGRRITLARLIMQER